MGSQTSVLLCVDKAGPNINFQTGSFAEFEFHFIQGIRLSNHSSKVNDVFLLSQMPTEKDI